MFSEEALRGLTVAKSEMRKKKTLVTPLLKHMILHSEQSSIHTEQKISLENAQNFAAM